MIQLAKQKKQKIKPASGALYSPGTALLIKEQRFHYTIDKSFDHYSVVIILSTYKVKSIYYRCLLITLGEIEYKSTSQPRKYDFYTLTQNKFLDYYKKSIVQPLKLKNKLSVLVSFGSVDQIVQDAVNDRKLMSKVVRQVAQAEERLKATKETYDTLISLRKK